MWGSVSVSDRPPSGAKLEDMIFAVLKEAGEALPIKAILAAIKEDYSIAAKEDTAKKALGRHPESFHQVGKTRPRLWQLTTGTAERDSLSGDEGNDSAAGDLSGHERDKSGDKIDAF
jgi:hypothetical protein